MQNSLQNYITSETIASEIALVRSGQKGQKRPIILVEGYDDFRVLRPILDKWADVIPGDGKEKNLGVLGTKQVTGSETWLLLIVDADFDRLQGVAHPPQVAMTDLHDWDCEYFRTQAVVKVVLEYCTEVKCQAQIGKSLTKETSDVVNAILADVTAAATDMGIMRYVSTANKFELSFKGLDHGKFTDKQEIKIVVKSLCRVLYSNSKQPKGSADVVENLFRGFDRSIIRDAWQVYRGHDLAAFLALGIKKKWGTPSCDVDKVESSLRLSYESAWFWKTNLAATLILFCNIPVDEKGNPTQ